MTRDIKTLVNALEIHKPDVVLNVLHGRWGEDGCVQGILEMIGIPYSNSGVLGSALAMNKVVARKLCQSVDIRVPEGQVAKLEDVCAGRIMQPPYVIKPIGEGSSLGVHVILDDHTPLPDPKTWPFDNDVLVERYIPGREIQVAVLGGKAKGTIEISPLGAFVDYEAKYTKGKSTRVVPAPLDSQTHAQVLDWAEKAHTVLECRGITRSDFRYDDTQNTPGKLYYLETNTQPGLTPTSFVPAIMAHEGMPYAQLIQWMIEDASCQR